MPIVISAFTEEARKSLNGSALGIVDWLEKPIDMERLRTAIEKARKGAFRRMPSVLHVEDDEDVLEVMSAGLGDDIAITFARNVQEARFELQQKHFDVVISTSPSRTVREGNYLAQYRATRWLSSFRRLKLMSIWPPKSSMP